MQRLHDGVSPSFLLTSDEPSALSSGESNLRSSTLLFSIGNKTFRRRDVGSVIDPSLVIDILSNDR